jgi:hypothetical protein
MDPHQLLHELAGRGRSLRSHPSFADAIPTEALIPWRSECLAVLEKYLGAEHPLVFGFCDLADPSFPARSAINEAANLLERAVRHIDTSETPAHTSTTRLVRVIDGFHRVVCQLRPCNRRKKDGLSRPTLEVEDEYDVQDLLHALLLIDFDDVRPEENTPSKGGKSARVDFLLPNEGIVIETKMMRDSLSQKDLTLQIHDDQGHYSKLDTCKQLVVFVYDPNHRVANPRGFQSDHTNGSGVNTRTFVRPLP